MQIEDNKKLACNMFFIKTFTHSFTTLGLARLVIFTKKHMCVINNARKMCNFKSALYVFGKKTLTDLKIHQCEKYAIRDRQR